MSNASTSFGSDDRSDAFPEYNISMIGNTLPSNIGFGGTLLLALFYMSVLTFVVLPLSTMIFVLDGWLLAGYIPTDDVVTTFQEWLLYEFDTRLSSALGLSLLAIELVIITIILFFTRREHYFIIVLALLVYKEISSVVIGLPLFILSYSDVDPKEWSLTLLVEQTSLSTTYELTDFLETFFEFNVLNFGYLVGVVLMIPVIAFVLQLFTFMYLKVASK